MTTFLRVALLLVFVLNAYATLRLQRSPLYDARQKRPQLFLIWLLPILGALLVIQFSKEQRPGGRPGDYAADCGSDGGGLGSYSAGDCGGGSGGGGDCGGGDGGGGGD